eukprot:6197677-Pleurochrysis_carterae.AAC.2
MKRVRPPLPCCTRRLAIACFTSSSWICGCGFDDLRKTARVKESYAREKDSNAHGADLRETP